MTSVVNLDIASLTCTGEPVNIWFITDKLFISHSAVVEKEVKKN
jgi:hypothetical protein